MTSYDMVQSAEYTRRWSTTVEPILKHTPNKRHHRNYLPTKDTFQGTKSRLTHSAGL